MAITFSLLFLFTAFGSLHLSIRRKSSHASGKCEEYRRQHIPTNFNNTWCSLVAMDQGIFTSATIWDEISEIHVGLETMR
jgi:hypothetical protein